MAICGGDNRPRTRHDPDSERNIVETSIIIEYLQLAHPGPVRLLARRFGHPRTSDSSAVRLPTPSTAHRPRMSIEPIHSRLNRCPATTYFVAGDDRLARRRSLRLHYPGAAATCDMTVAFPALSKTSRHPSRA